MSPRTDPLEVPANPQRVIVLSSYVDDLLTLGVNMNNGYYSAGLPKLSLHARGCDGGFFNSQLYWFGYGCCHIRAHLHINKEDTT